jgi:predicted transposase/invertase (TIGR01784 family)
LFLNFLSDSFIDKNISLVRSEEIVTIVEQLFKEGMEEGLQKGIIEGRKKTAKNLLKLRLPIEQVAKATELSYDEVVQLKREFEGV